MNKKLSPTPDEGNAGGNKYLYKLFIGIAERNRFPDILFGEFAERYK